MVIGHVDFFVQSHTRKCVWLPLATKIAAWKLYLLFKFGQDYFVFRIVILIVGMCPTSYQMILNTYNKQNPNILIIQTGNLKFAAGDYISPVGRQKVTKQFF